MAIITISRFEGCKGSEIAKDIADELGYTLIDRTWIHGMARSFKGNFTKEIEVLENENRPGFFDFLFRQRSVYGHMISSMIYDAVSKDKAVILGRGGQFLLQNRPHVINARLTAPFEIRLARIMAALNIEKVIADDYLESSDRKRRDFIRYLYHEDVTDACWYDITIDTKRFDSRSIGDFLVHELKRIDTVNPMSEADKTAYRNLALEKRVEIVLMKELSESNYIRVTVSDEGTVVLTGFLGSEAERAAAVDLARGVDGVKTVDNRIIVSDYPVRPWY